MKSWEHREVLGW